MTAKYSTQILWRLTTPKTLALSAMMFLTACASHRSKPPACDGPYSPINVTNAELIHDAQH